MLSGLLFGLCTRIPLKSQASHLRWQTKKPHFTGFHPNSGVSLARGPRPTWKALPEKAEASGHVLQSSHAGGAARLPLAHACPSLPPHRTAGRKRVRQLLVTRVVWLSPGQGLAGQVTGEGALGTRPAALTVGLLLSDGISQDRHAGRQAGNGSHAPPWH